MKNILFSLIFIIFTVSLFSQQIDSTDEVVSTVPELDALHEVVHQMWHDAYPNKDVNMLKDLLPLMQTSVEKIYKVELPPLLNESKDRWNQNVEKLRGSSEKYKRAIEENDEDKLLEATGEIHSEYEMFVRIVTPVTKEIGEFHKMLFRIYDNYLPNDNTDKLNSAIDDLVILADSLMNSKLPKWAADKNDEFVLSADNLYNSTLDLQELKDSDAGKKQIENGVEVVDVNFKKLVALFEE